MKKLFIISALLTTMNIMTFAQQVKQNPHDFRYLKNELGLHFEMTNGTIIVENYDNPNAFVLGNIVLIGTESYPILSLLYEEMDQSGRVGRLLKKKELSRLSITLTNGEVFSCGSQNTNVKEGYAKIGSAVAVSVGIPFLRSTNSPTGLDDNCRYVLKQLTSFSIQKVVIDDCQFKIGSSVKDQEVMNSAPTIKAMCDDLKSKVDDNSKQYFIVD